MKTGAPAHRRTDAPGARRALWRIAALIAALQTASVAGTIAQAQAPAPQPTRAPAVVHYGKWAVLGLAAGFTLLGVQSHDRADRAYASLLGYCSGAVPCPVGADGRYTNGTAEALYQRVRSGDRAARAWLVGGQAALAGGAVLFVMELRRQKGPENIPFSPYVVGGRFGTRIGVQLAWR